MIITAEQAYQFALMLSAGLPATDALSYFYPDVERRDLPRLAEGWQRDPEVQKAVLQIQGKAWQGMSTDERIKFAIDKTYNEMAYFLYSRNYAELTGAERQKADICRQSLEAKLAGMAGKMGALEQFYADLSAGRVAGIKPATSIRPN